jgi:hypothetical protein
LVPHNILIRGSRFNREVMHWVKPFENRTSIHVRKGCPGANSTGQAPASSP